MTGAWRRRQAPAALFVLFCLVASLHAADEGEPREPGRAKILDFNRTLVYINAGREDGLQEGDTIEVVRDDAVLTTLRVAYLASHRASCTFDAAEIPFEVGDLVRFVPHEAKKTPVSSLDGKSRSRKSGSAMRRAGLRGRVGVRYLLIRDQLEDGSNMSQPGLDLRLEGGNIAGGNVGLSIDVRSHRTYSTFSDGTGTERDRTRIHRMSVSYFEPRSGFSVRVGRQYSPTLSSISIFDGALVDFARPHWNVGGFTGSEPDPVDYTYTTETRQHGFYVSTHSASRAPKLWSVTLGSVGSYESGEIDREFLFLQTRYGGPRLSVYLAQEVDYNRGWKEEFEDESFSPTSTFFNLQYRATRGLRFHAGYDTRRRVRLYRDRITPETEFDDSNRLGARLGWTWNNRHYRVGMDGYSNTGETIGDGESYSLYFGATGFTRAQVGVTTRSTVYRNERAEGELYSVAVGANLGSRVHFQVGGGLRDEIVVAEPTLAADVTWVTLDLDFNLGRRWYLLLSGERNVGGIDNNIQVFSSLTYRF